MSNEPNDAIDRLGDAILKMCNLNESDIKVREPRAFVDNSSLTKINELEAEAAGLRTEVERLKARLIAWNDKQPKESSPAIKLTDQ